MATGRLGVWELYSSIYQSVYQCTTDDVAVVNISLCNRAPSSTYIRVAITAAENNPTDDEFIEYDTKLLSSGVLERTGLIIPAGYYLTVRSTGGSTSAVLWGQEMGTESGDLQPVINDGAAPVWNTAADLGTVYEGLEMNPIQLDADDPDGASVDYSLTSGTLPGGMTLSESGVLSGLIQENDAYQASGVQYNVSISANDARRSTPRAFSIIRKWAPGSLIDEPLNPTDNISTIINQTGQTQGDIYITDSQGSVVATKLFTTNSTTGISTNADYTGTSNTGWVLLGSISDNTTHGQQTGGDGSWHMSWTDTNTFGTPLTLFQDQSYKNSLYFNWDYKDILIMQILDTSVAEDDYYNAATEVAFTSSEFLATRGNNLRDMFRGTNGPDIRTNGDSGRFQVPLTFLKGSAAASRARYRPNGRGELTESNEIDFGIRNNENYRYAMVNALGCRATGANTEHYSWVADIDTNYSEQNFPEPNWTGDWGIDVNTGRLTWLIWGTN